MTSKSLRQAKIVEFRTSVHRRHPVTIVVVLLYFHGRSRKVDLVGQDGGRFLNLREAVKLRKQSRTSPNQTEEGSYFRLFSRRPTAGSSLCLDFQKAAQRSPTFSMRCRMEEMFHFSGEILAVSSPRVIGVETGAWGNARTE